MKLLHVTLLRTITIDGLTGDFVRVGANGVDEIDEQPNGEVHVKRTGKSVALILKPALVGAVLPMVEVEVARAVQDQPGLITQDSRGQHPGPQPSRKKRGASA